MSETPIPEAPVGNYDNVSGSTDDVYVLCALNEIRSRTAKSFQLMRVDDDGSQKVWSIFVARWGSQVFGYVNVCPHQHTHLDWERDQFFDSNNMFLQCGKHGATFELGTGRCTQGPCQGDMLMPVPVAVIDGDICVVGVKLAEDDEVEDEIEAASQCMGGEEDIV